MSSSFLEGTIDQSVDALLGNDCPLLSLHDQIDALTRRIEEADERSAKQQHINRSLQHQYDGLLRLHEHIQRRYQQTIEENRNLRQQIAEQHNKEAVHQSIRQLMSTATPPHTANVSAFTSPAKRRRLNRNQLYDSTVIVIPTSAVQGSQQSVERDQRKRRLF